MKRKALWMTSICMLLLVPMASRAKADNVPFHTTLEGGVKVFYQQASSDLRSTLLLKPNNGADFSGDGVSIRIKNHITSGDGSPLFIFMNETDSDRVQAGLASDKTYALYDLNGGKEDKTYRSGDHAIVLPASFDGYLYLPYESFAYVSGYGSGNGTMNYGSVYGVYIELNTYYDSFSNFSLGGVEVLKEQEARTLLDPTTLNDLTYANYYVKDYNGSYINLEHESVGSGEIGADMNYQNIDLPTNLQGGLQVSYIGSETDVISQFIMAPTLRNYGEDAHALAFRIKNQTSISTPITMGVKNRRGNVFYVNKSTGKYIFFKEKNGTLAINGWRDWDSAVVIPSNFDGWMILPLAIFNTVNAADPTDIRSILFATSVYKYYDAFTILTFGDVSIIKNDQSLTSLISFKDMDDTKFESTFSKIQNEEYIRFTRYEEAKAVAERKGDVKFLERLDHVTNDQELNAEFPVWSGGSKLTTHYVETYDGHHGMQVDIGEVIPNKNIYGSINVFPKYYTSDWNNWADGGENHDQAAKGVTCYLKNLSRKEIIMNLEFDEITKKNNQNVTERWNVQLGAMILYYDINTGNEFIRMAKPAMVIPIGFEGYVRIAFNQYQVPAWCVDGDLSLDVTANMAGMYITADCSNNEGLSFVISDFGIYFNHTEISTLFEKSPNSIQENMKGETL